MTLDHADSAHVAALHPSRNIGERRKGLLPRMLILHYTGLPSIERSIAVLSDPAGKVSCHYVIAEDGRITQMVAEEMRAWHAGLSYWAGETDINSASIGIEIQNTGHAGGSPPFPPVQMEAVRDLALDICRRNGIAPHGVLAHSDIAPARKIDPGEYFPWAWLANAGLGHWIDPAPPEDDGVRLGLGDVGLAVEEMQSRLAAYGYGLPRHGRFDIPTQYAVIAFQRHFRPARVDAVWDSSCAVTLDGLLDSMPGKSLT